MYTLWVSIVLQMLCVVFGMCLGVLTNVLVITVVLLHKKSTSHTNNVFLTHVCKLVRCSVDLDWTSLRSLQASYQLVGLASVSSPGPMPCSHAGAGAQEVLSGHASTLFTYAWLCWVFVAVLRLSSCGGGDCSLVVVHGPRSGGFSCLQSVG